MLSVGKKQRLPIPGEASTEEEEKGGVDAGPHPSNDGGSSEEV